MIDSLHTAAGTALAFALALTLTGVATAAPPEPAAGTYRFQWKKAGCFDTVNGLRKFATARTEVTYLADGAKTHYQEVKVQIDKQSGFAGRDWSKVSAKTYDWSRFTGAGLPTWSTSSMRTGLGHDAATYTAKATVWLKQVRRGPDKTVWRYKRRSIPFRCYDDGALPNPGAAPPSTGGD